MASMFEQDYINAPVRDSYVFPDPRSAPDEGLLAYGGDLSADRLLAAYQKGIFPWYSKNGPILWWSPNPRLVLYPKHFKVKKSFRRVLKNGQFTVTFDRNFADVIHLCATTPREGQKDTWIVPQMRLAYLNLHRHGVAHSVEVHKKGRLVGGLYGVAMGKGFFGESMFSLVSDASKIALKALSDVLGSKGYDFIDCQMKTDHLVRLGAQVISRDRFLDELESTLQKPSDLGYWHHFFWEYNNG